MKVDKSDYISNNLRKMNTNAIVVNEDEQTTNKINNAQKRRLSDVYSAKIDLAARISRKIAQIKMQEIETNSKLINLNEIQKKIVDMAKTLDELNEPDEGIELLKYIKEVEHLRLEFFSYEESLDLDMPVEKNPTITSFADMAQMGGATIFKFAFIWSLPIIITLFFAATIVATAIYLAMRL